MVPLVRALFHALGAVVGLIPGWGVYWRQPVGVSLFLPHHQSQCKAYPQVRAGWLVDFWKANSVQVTLPKTLEL